MPRQPHKPVPVNLIAGSLGVGKTTTINHLLANRPADERWAVLVNEYGLVGLDAALMATEPTAGEPDGVWVREVAGGCICCSAGMAFEVALVRLLRRRPDRLLIEPTGFAALSGILDTLDRPGICEAVDVRSVICLLDPARLDADLERETVRDQVEAADVLLGNRADLATAAQRAAFLAWGADRYPPKRHVGLLEQGRVPFDVLDAVQHRASAIARAGHRHGTNHATSADHDHGDEHAHAGEPRLPDAETPLVERAHRAADASTLGWIAWRGLAFRAEAVTRWLSRLSQLPGARRTKAVLRTTEGWWAFNHADGVERLRRSSHRRDSRIEVVIEGEAWPDSAVWAAELRACVVEATRH